MFLKTIYFITFSVIRDHAFPVPSFDLLLFFDLCGEMIPLV